MTINHPIDQVELEVDRITESIRKKGEQLTAKEVKVILMIWIIMR